MKWSQSHLFTIKDAPADAEIESHKLLIRAGLIKKVSPGVFTYAPLMLRSMRKFERIVREELDKRGAQELLMPAVHPRALWDETGRWAKMGPELLKFQNRNDQWFCLGGTHEEVITDFVRHDVKSYRDLPVCLYQIQTKYRDEIRPRYGLMRGREFTMKDAYSFDVDQQSAVESYERYYQAYVDIFKRTGLEFRVVDADSGNIGGNRSNEFQVLAESGEDKLLVAGDFAANVEVCPAVDAEPIPEFTGDHLSQEEFATPGLRTIEDLSKNTGVPQSGLVKTLFFSANDGLNEADKALKPVCVLLRGDDELNPIKLKKVLDIGTEPRMLTDEEVREVTGALPGSCGPVGLKIPVYMDEGVKNMANYIVGANKDDFHLKNVNHPRDFEATKVADLRFAKAGDLAPDGQGVLKAYRGIEVGHVFYLGTTYSAAMNAIFQAADGKTYPIEMGCYGIGVTRTVQAAVEQCHDEDGIAWPDQLAPYHVHVCLLDPDDDAAKETSEKIYNELWSAGVEVMVDDRSERPGVKFKDADLLGMPVRLVIGARGLKNGVIEYYERRERKKSEIPIADVVSTIKKRFEGLQ